MPQDQKKLAPVCETTHLDAAHEAEIVRSIPTEDEAVDAAALFAHLADSTRVRILSMLSVSGMCVCEMSDILGMSQPAVSHHLRILRQCGIVRFKKQGKRALYFLNDTEECGMIRILLRVACAKEE